MPTTPMLARRRLGNELRTLRELRRLTIEEVGSQLGWHKSKVSRIENAQSGITRRDLYKLMELYEVDSDGRDKCEALVADGRERSWWAVAPYADVLNNDYQEQIGLEAEAAAAWEYQPLLIPGLLQTADYSRAVIGSGPFVQDEEDIETLVEVRQRRQRVLLTEDDPVEYSGVITMAALMYEVGGKQALRAQLAHLLDVAERPNVTVQVIPYDAMAPSSAGLTLLHFRDAQDPSVAFVDTVSVSFQRDNAREIRRYVRFFEYLRTNALDSQNTQAIIKKRLEDLK
ncbi:helix-turn-helix domain-containing protein [Embleya sp. AB8]|uniref:helix-turn-helix domain-containing protein n=1 Tax=Embleya sp. AB8 TaxID=3156304 RepID=UPI003C77B773